jgi:biotin carboxyl carrier protein
MKFVAQHEERTFEVEVERFGSGYRVRLDDRWIQTDLINAGGYVRSLRLEDGSQFSLLHHREGSIHEVSLAGSNVQVEIINPLSLKRRREDDAGSGGIIKALMPGRVTRVLIAEGDSVRKGTGLLILEAMKMENEIPAPADGTVDRIFVSAGQTVESGAELVHLSPARP